MEAGAARSCGEVRTDRQTDRQDGCREQAEDAVQEQLPSSLPDSAPSHVEIGNQKEQLPQITAPK